MPYVDMTSGTPAAIIRRRNSTRQLSGVMKANRESW